MVFQTHDLCGFRRECFINPRRMRRRVTVVVLCVCLSVNSLTATYLVCELQGQCYNIL